MAHKPSGDRFSALSSTTHHGVDSEPDTYMPDGDDFDVSVKTGFLPLQPPLIRLTPQYEIWEQTLDNASSLQLKLGERNDLTEKDRMDSATWRRDVEEMPILSTDHLTRSEVLLRRAHHVLTFILHLYVHTQPPPPPCAEIRIPQSISIPLLQVCASLTLPPVLSYSDNVLYNWTLSHPQSPSSPSIDSSHLRIKTTFTGTPDEEHFYLTSLRIELLGVSALSLMRSVQDAAVVGDLLSFRRIAECLAQLAIVIDTMTKILNDVRNGCDPTVFYEQVRPWFRGQSSRRWIFEGTESAGLQQPTELAGPSAGQSSLIHALDIFLGVDQFSHSHVAGSTIPAPPSAAHSPEKDAPFLERIQSYMPRRHRAFLNHLKANARSLRDIITADDIFVSIEGQKSHQVLKTTYNAAVRSLKGFRDAHIRIATLYIVNPARRVQSQSEGEAEDRDVGVARGTGGTDLVPFLKGVRDKTAAAVLT